MRIAGNVVGVILLLLGLVWILQGLNVLQGSAVMSGKNEWAVIGMIVVLVSLAVFWWANLRRAAKR